MVPSISFVATWHSLGHISFISRSDLQIPLTCVTMPQLKQLSQANGHFFRRSADTKHIHIVCELSIASKVGIEPESGGFMSFLHMGSLSLHHGTFSKGGEQRDHNI